MSADTQNEIGMAQFVLYLHSVPQLGEKSLTRLFAVLAQQRLTPTQCLALTASEWKARFDLKASVANSLTENKSPLLAKSAELLKAFRVHPLYLITQSSAAYPAKLERYDETPPPILYALGNARLLELPQASQNALFTFTVAVSNDAVSSSLDRADEIANALIVAGGVPVTGHDRLPYQRLALCAQRLDKSILYVLDRGLREALGADYDRPPFAAARIRDAVFEPRRDVAISPFRLDDHGLGANNKRRDRLIFALSDVVIVADIRSGGGMMSECIRAFEQSKIVRVLSEGGREGNTALLGRGVPALDLKSGWAAELTDQVEEK